MTLVHLFVLLFGFVMGVAVTVLVNHFFPDKVDKASKELGEEVDKLRK